jgi:very-short-patch-repair endonuclease
MPEPCENEGAGGRILRKVRPFAVAQDAVVSRRQLMTAGATADAIKHARRSGRLYDVHPGVYSIVPPEMLGEDALLIAALLEAGGDTMLARGTAAWRQRIIPAPPLRIQLVSPRAVIPSAGIEVARCTTLRPGDVGRAGRFRCTTVARTLLDLAVDYRPEPLLRALEEAEFEHDLRPEDVLAALRRGHRGSAALRAALERHVPGYGKVKLRLERRFRGLLIAHGIALPLRNTRIGPYVVDCLWPAARLVGELDGRWHERPHQRGVDSERDLYLRALGYVVVRYTWRQVHEDAAAVAADVAGLLAVRS